LKYHDMDSPGSANEERTQCGGSDEKGGWQRGKKTKWFRRKVSIDAFLDLVSKMHIGPETSKFQRNFGHALTGDRENLGKRR